MNRNNSSTSIWQRRALRYGLAFVAVAAGFGLRLALTAWVGPGLPTYITFYPAVMVAALLAGFGPGLVATTLTGLSVAYWILPPEGFFIASPVERLGLVLFAGMGLFMSAVAEFYRRDRRKAAAYDREMALRESEERLRFALETSHIGAWDLDLVDHTAFRSPEHDRIFGYAELLPKWTYEMFLEHVLPEDRAMVDGKFRRAMESQGDWNIECRIRRTDGQIRWIWAAGQHRLDATGAARRMAGVVLDITERKLVEEALKFLAQCGTMSSGEGFFKELARYLARILGMDFVCIDRLEGGLLAARTLAVFHNGRFEDNVSYTLRDTPCGDVVGQRICCFPRNVRGLFPKDAVLQDLLAESYLGTTLWNSQGKPIGLIAVIGRQPLTDTRLAESILQLVAVRAAGELERQQADEALQKLNEELELRVADRTAELRATSRYARSLLEASLDPLVTISPEGRVTDVNHATELATGLPRERLVGSNFSDYFTEPDNASAGYRRVLAQGEVRDYPLTIRHASGRTIDVLYNAVVYHDEAGRVLGVFAAARDVTEHKRIEAELALHRAHLEELVGQRTAELESANARLKTEIAERRRAEDQLRLQFSVLQSADNGLAITGRDGVIQWVNAAFTRLTGYTATEAVGQNPRVLKSGRQSPEFFKDLWQTILSGRVWHGELVNKRKDGSLYPEEMTITPVADADGKITHFVAVKQDITARKQAEAAMQKTAADLARSNLDLEQFAYVASHDLQEPLRAVGGYVKLLQHRFPEKLDAKAHEYVAGAADGAERMQRLIADLLAFSRVGTRGNTFAPADLNALLRDALNNLQTSIKEAGAKVTSDPLPSLPVDATQIRQLFQNLIGNAIKFHSDLTPVIHVGARQEKERWLFGVQDNGIGIEPQYAGRIFQIFQRLHSRKHYPGTGIGLAICKKIVERHGGEIRVESEPAKGSTFYFSIPEISAKMEPVP